jgi:hypothetical protein
MWYILQNIYKEGLSPNHFSVVRPTLLYFWLACHAALDAASRLCFSGFLLEFIPMKIGAGMTIIVKGFMAQHIRM